MLPKRMQQMTMPLIECQNLHFHYSSNKNFELDIPQFHVSKNEHIFIEGASGSGKTTFLNLLTGLLHPQKGAINILGKNIAKLNQIECDRFRADHFGIIFQLFNPLLERYRKYSITLFVFTNKKIQCTGHS
jgi:putative ABC transport system ATP-binding protein